MYSDPRRMARAAVMRLLAGYSAAQDLNRPRERISRKRRVDEATDTSESHRVAFLATRSRGRAATLHDARLFRATRLPRREYTRCRFCHTGC